MTQELLNCAKQQNRWYVAATAPQKEIFAVRNLRQQNFRTFFPQVKRGRVSRNKTTQFLQPLFPGYIFVYFDSAMDRWQAINSTYGVRKLVGARDCHPNAVPGQVMDKLLACCPSEIWDCKGSGLRPGQSVELISGPFAGVPATFDEFLPKDRVRILLNWLNRDISVIITANNISY